MFSFFLWLEQSRKQRTIATVDPNEIAPSVDYKISNKKVNQIYIALLGHSYSAFWNLDVNNITY